LLGHEQKRLLMKHRLQQGFSIVEIVIVVGVLALLLSFAMPSISDLITNGRIRTAAEGMLNGIQLARAEAVRRNTAVDLRIGADGVSWNIFLTTDPGTDPTTAIQTRSADAGSATVCVSSGGTFAGAAPCTQSPPFAATTVRFDGWGVMRLPVVPAGESFAIRYASPIAGNRAMCVAMIANTPRLCDPQRRLLADGGTDPNAATDPQACYSGGTFIAGC
jgi:type IV fimbrial biogenesis protein FimT